MKNKILASFMAVLLVCFCFINSCFAYSSDYEFYPVDDTTLNNINEQNSKYNSGNNYYIFLVDFNDSSVNYMYFWDKNSNVSPYVEYNEEMGCYLLYLGSSNNTINFRCVRNSTYISDYSDNYLYGVAFSTAFGSNTIVYKGSSCTDIFFYQTPQILAKELVKVEVMKVIKKVMLNVVVSLVVFLVGFLSLKKGWTFLKKVLKKA